MQLPMQVLHCFKIFLYYSHTIILCRIEAAEKRNNRDWEEDWGAKGRPKSPKSPRTPKSKSPAPSDIKTTTPKAKSSRKNDWIEWS